MKKDVIYIDVEDDITAIIGKVKLAESKIVALVPPKRTGVLQSVVNLKLLQKSASASDKRVVLITSDHSLTSLAAGVKILVARNLQTKPEVPQMTELNLDDNDVIDGADLPIGEIAAAAGFGEPNSTSVAEEISNNVDLTDKLTPKKPSTNQPKSPFGKIKIPDFNKFRKKFFIISGGLLLLGGFLIWALIIAPEATVTITAKTSVVNIDRSLKLVSGDSSRLDKLQLKSQLMQLKKTATVEFDATGTKEIGVKAQTIITVSNSYDSDSIAIPNGTVFIAANGKQFISSAAVSVPGYKKVSGKDVPGTASVSVVAAEIGPDYNIAAQTYLINGFNEISAVGVAAAGGNKEQVKIVTQADVDAAKVKLAQQDVAAVKTELQSKFSPDQLIIQESFVAEPGDPVASPAVGEQAQKAKLSADTNYSLVAISRSDVKSILESVLKDAMAGKSNQNIFNNGESSIQFQAFQKTGNQQYNVKLITTGYIGSAIDAKQLATQLKGKRYGEIEQVVNSIPGVNKVDILFSPAWVTSAPSNPDRIKIKFTVVNDTE